MREYTIMHEYIGNFTGNKTTIRIYLHLHVVKHKCKSESKKKNTFQDCTHSLTTSAALKRMNSLELVLNTGTCSILTLVNILL